MDFAVFKENALWLFIAFFCALFVGKILVPWLTKRKVDQTERDIMESHVKKNGTPTMGGFIFLIPFVVLGIVAAQKAPHLVPLLIGTLAFGLIGFLDDFLKVVLKRSDGLIAWQKFLLQFIAATLLYVYIRYYTDISLDLVLPFTHGQTVSIGLIAIPLFYLAVLGTVNGVNFTDGIDGLAATVTLMTTGFLFITSVIRGGGIETGCAILLGALLAFLFFNVNPAKIFMGDTGSLALGGFVAAGAYVLNIPVFILVFGFIYLLEVVSVILQVGSFKLRHGKRIFRMAPIHHHFELGGWSEPKIVCIFSGVTFLLAALCLAALV